MRLQTLAGRITIRKYIHVANVLTDSKTSFPDPNALPQKKAEPKWLRQFAEAAWAARNNMPSGGLGYSSRDLYKTWWDYAFNRQSLDLYKKLSGIANDDLIGNNSRLPLSNRFFNIVVGLIEKQGYKVRIGTIDPQASIELAKTQAERKARLMIRKMMPEAAEHPLIAAQPGEPDDLEGLEIMAMGERHPICADAQDIIRAVFNNNKFDRLRREAIQWCFIAGAAVAKDDTEPDGITTRLCQLGDVILPYCKYPDFSDLTYIGEIRTIPVSALIEMSCGQLKKLELQSLYEQGNQSLWLEDDYNDRDNWWSGAKVKVLDLEIRSTDVVRKEEYKNKEGNLRYRDVVLKKDGTEKSVEGSKKTDMEVQNIYRVKWVVGTDIVFDHGKALNVKRDGRNPARAQFSYHIVAPNIKDMVPYSRMAAIIPMVDDIQVVNYKRRQTLYRAIPSGYAIDMEGLEDIDLTGAGKAMTKKDLLDYFARTGNILFRSRAVNGSFKGASGIPVQFIKGGVGDEIVEYSNQILFNIDVIRQTLGLNEVTDGSTVNAKNLNSTNQAMTIGTNNALSDLFFASKQFTEEIAASVLIRAQDMLRPDQSGKSRSEDLAAIIGKDSSKRIGQAPALDKYHFGITIEDEPTAAEQEDFNMSLNNAMATGQISIDERFMAKSIAEDNIVQAQLYLSYRVRKNKEEQQQNAIQQQKSNADVQVQSARAVEEEKRKTIQFQTDEEIRKARELHPFKMLEIGAQGGVTLEAKRIDASGRVESAFTQATERDNSNIRDNTGKLIKEGMGDKVDAVNIPANLESRVEPITSNENPQLPKPAFSFLQEEQPMQPPQEEMQMEPMPGMME